MNTARLEPFPYTDTIPYTDTVPSKQKIETKCPFRTTNERSNFAPACLKSACGLWDDTIDQCVFMNLSKISFH